MLRRSFCEFNFNDQNVQDSIYEKYCAKLNQNDLIGLELFANYYAITSTRFRYRQFYAGCGPELAAMVYENTYQRNSGSTYRSMEYLNYPRERVQRYRFE